MRRFIVLLVWLSLFATGCSIEAPDIPDLNLSLNTGHNNDNIDYSNKSNDPGYAIDNGMTFEYGQYDSGIYANDVELAAPYGQEIAESNEIEDTDGLDELGDASESSNTDTDEIEDDELSNIGESSDMSEVEGTGDPGEPVDVIEVVDTLSIEYIESQLELLDIALKSCRDSSGNLIVNQMEYETLEEANIRAQSHEDSIKSDIEKLNYQLIEADKAMYNSEELKDIVNVIYNNIYSNGLNLLHGVKSADSFYEAYGYTITHVVNRINSSLEKLEYCDNLIQTKFNRYDGIVKSWENLKPVLVEFRASLAPIKTEEDFMQAGLEISDEQGSLFKEFRNATIWSNQS